MALQKPKSGFALVIVFAKFHAAFMQRSYQKLVVWKEADDLCVYTYEVTRVFPAEEKFGLVSQMRRSASSIATNIVEGNSRRTPKDRGNFFTIALASLDELHYQYHLSLRLKYIDQKIFDTANDRMQRVGYLLVKLRSSSSSLPS